MRKKKKGSSLVLVLIFTLFFTAISGVVVLAVVGTTKANSAQEVWEDTYYVADSAVETAVIKASEGDFDTLLKQPTDGTQTSVDYQRVYQQSEAFAGCSTFPNKEVTVKVTKRGDRNAADTEYINEYFLIESTAKDTVKNQERTIKAKIAKRLGSGDLFKYMICGKEVYIEVDGAALDGQINSTNFDADITVNGGHMSLAPNERADFTLPQFNFNEMSHNEVSGVGSSSGFDILFGMANSTGTNGVLKFKVDSTKYGGAFVDVYLVNMPEDSPNLKITSSAAGGFSNAIILTNGNIEIECGGSFSIQYGSIIADDIRSSGGGSLTLSFPPYGTADSRLNEADLQTLNSIIATHSTNWDASGEVGGSSDYWDAMEYK